MHLGPAFRADTDDSSRANALDDQVGLKLDLNAAAAQGYFSACLGDAKDFASGRDVGRPVVAGGVLQGILGSIDLCLYAFSEVVVERRIHAAEKRRGYGGAAELAILDGIDPGRHPAAADEGFVRLGLKLGGVLNGGVVQPDVRDVEARESAI